VIDTGVLLPVTFTVADPCERVVTVPEADLFWAATSKVSLPSGAVTVAVAVHGSAEHVTGTIVGLSALPLASVTVTASWFVDADTYRGERLLDWLLFGTTIFNVTDAEPRSVVAGIALFEEPPPPHPAASAASAANARRRDVRSVMS
jgi:hypothetical protein